MASLCPSCHTPTPRRSENPSAPFCSPRCRQVDLGRWLGEEYRVPEHSEDGEPEAPASRTADEDEDTR